VRARLIPTETTAPTTNLAQGELTMTESNGKTKTSVHIETQAGDMFANVVREAISTATATTTVHFKFNSVEVKVATDSDPELIDRDYHRAMAGKIPTNKVGPYPNNPLTTEQVVYDRLMDESNQKRRSEADAKWKAKQDRAADILNEALAKAPEFNASDIDGWTKAVEANTDSYSKGVIDFARCWGRLMQLGVQRGQSIASVAKLTSNMADVAGITGFMYGAAVSTLSKTWIHGDDLRRWHNIDCQIGNEGEKANITGGTLNPALLGVG